jgi:biopolymer transport protein ExbD
MATWDILHVKSLEVEHSVPEAKILEDLKERRLSRDDCVRKPGEDRWWRIYEVKTFRAGASDDAVLDEPPKLEDVSLRNILADAEPPPEAPRRPRGAVPMATPAGEKPAGQAMSFGETTIGAVVEEPEEGLPYRKKTHQEDEELDMTPMVDVAMQLILFFMVTSTMIMQMCLSFPQPAPDENQRAEARPTPQTLDDLKKDSIVVKIKGDNSILVDEEKVPTKDTDLVAKLQKIKHDRNPNGGVVIQAEEAAYHETVVKVVDSVNEARLDPIKMANPIKQAKKATKKRAIK